MVGRPPAQSWSKSAVIFHHAGLEPRLRTAHPSKLVDHRGNSQTLNQTLSPMSPAIASTVPDSSAVRLAPPANIHRVSSLPAGCARFPLPSSDPCSIHREAGNVHLAL